MAEAVREVQESLLGPTKAMKTLESAEAGKSRLRFATTVATDLANPWLPVFVLRSVQGKQTTFTGVTSGRQTQAFL